MNFKKTWKRFFSLSRHNEGFTLVEMIVVIAILAILAGIGVPAYNGYIEKANMAADQKLASEVAHALTLYYYGNHAKEGVAGYIALSTTAAPNVAGVSEDVMANVFGEGWKDDQSLRLKYTGWTSSAAISTLLDGNAQSVANSTFVQSIPVEDTMKTVSAMTNALALAVSGGDNPAAALKNLSDGTLDLSDLDKTALGDNYATAVANKMVSYLANEAAGASADKWGGQDAENMVSPLAQLAQRYAVLYAFSANNTDAKNILDTLNTNLANAKENSNGNETQYILDSFDTAMGQAAQIEAFGSYAGSALGNDMTALKSILTAVDSTIDADPNSYTSVDSLKNTNLYTSDAITDQLENYYGAAKTIAGLTDEQVAALSTSGVVLYLDSTGNVSSSNHTIY